MAKIYTNILDSLIHHLGVGCNSEPISGEDHIDITCSNIVFNAYYDEENENWKSTNATANFCLRQDSNNFTLSYSTSNDVGEVITWEDRIVLSPLGIMTISGNKRNRTDYTDIINTLTIDQSGYTITNQGATSDVVVNLPEATADVIGVNYYFHVRAAQNLIIKPYSSETIRDLGSTTTVEIKSNTIDDSVRLICIDIGTWVTEAKMGTWTLS